MIQTAASDPAPKFAPPRVRPAWLAGLPVAVVLAGGLAFGCVELARQWLISRVEGAAGAADGTAPGPALARLAEAERDCQGDCGPRALVAGGAARASIAGRLPPGPQRDALAAQAVQDLDAAVAEQSASGDRWAWLAVAESEQSGDDHHRQAVAALERSYRLAPFVRELALWRTRFVGSDWSELDALSRQRAVDEVARLSLVDPGQAEQAALAFSDPAAGSALGQRMAQRGAAAR